MKSHSTSPLILASHKPRPTPSTQPNNINPLNDHLSHNVQPIPTPAKPRFSSPLLAPLHGLSAIWPTQPAPSPPITRSQHGLLKPNPKYGLSHIIYKPYYKIVVTQKSQVGFKWPILECGYESRIQCFITHENMGISVKAYPGAHC